jgi:hypothetical protein
LCFRAMVGCMIIGLACVFKTAFRVGARHPILEFGHQIAYLIGRPLLLIMGGLESKSYKQFEDKHYVNHVKGEL